MIVMDQSANYEQYTIYLLQNWTEGRQERFFAESITTDIIDALVDAWNRACLLQQQQNMLAIKLTVTTNTTTMTN